MKAIKVENLSKAYQLGQIGTGTISRDIERWAARIRGKEDPFLKIGETNDRTSKGESDIVWSLKDLNFEIEQGDAVGIIGSNGAGKSTLLKLLSRVTAPTTGNIKIKGRVASLLEVGTGFHPELSGRENIFLNGAILGMRKKEITRQLDEIVDFAGVERYLDTPVKRYSSGMYVRLAFAVAAHLESEILIVDEVLAVGDAEFQKKCIGKMGDVSKGEGRTVLFVSHNMGSISKLCDNSMLITKGELEVFESTTNVLDTYAKSQLTEVKKIFSGDKIVSRVSLNNLNNEIQLGAALIINIEFMPETILQDPVIGFVIKNNDSSPIHGLNNKNYNIKINNTKPLEKCKISIPKLMLIPGEYILDIFIGDGNKDIEICENAVSFEVIENYHIPSLTNININLNKVYLEDVVWSIV